MDKSFNSFERESNRVPIHTGSSISMSDISTVAKTSPYTFLASGNIFEIKVPLNAAEIVFHASKDINISKESDLSNYFTVPAGIILAIGVARLDSLYFDASADAGDLNFYFVTV